MWTCPGCPAPPDWRVDLPALVEELPWLRPLGGCPQDPIFHAEGDVLTHLGMVLAELATLPAFRELPEAERHVLFAGTLLHDIAKPECTFEEAGRVRSPGHAVKGVSKARRLLATDPVFGALGTPFREREQILGLVRWHGLPANYPQKPHAGRDVLRAAYTTRLDWLAIVAEADHRGRVCKVPADDTLERILLFPEFCREWECWPGPRAFANDASRFAYFRTETAHPTLHLFDDARCEVTVMCGLPGSGKSTWAAANCPDLPAVSLDDIREELDVDPGDNQSAVVVAAYDRARGHLRRGESFLWNATNVSRLLRGKLIDLAADYRARVRIVYVEPPIPLIRERNRGRAKHVPERVWDRMFDKLDMPTLAEAHRVDSVVG